MISPNTIRISIINDVESATENHDRRCSIDDSVASFDLVRRRNRSTNILPFLALIALVVVSLVSIIQLSNSNTIFGGTVSNQQFERIRRLSPQKRKSNDYDSGLTLNYNPASIVVVENPGPDAEELITDSIEGEEKGAVEETNEERTKLVYNKKAAAALAVAGVAVVVNNSDLDRIENELDVKNNRDRNKEDVEGDSSRKPNTSGTVGNGGPYPNDVDAILDAIAEEPEEPEPKPTRNRSKGTLGSSCVFNGACEEGLVCVSRTCEEVTQSTRRRDRSDAPSNSPSTADPTSNPAAAPKRANVMGYYTGTDIPATAGKDDYNYDTTLYPTSTPTEGLTEEEVEAGRPLGSMFGSMIGRNDDEEEEQDDYGYSNNGNDDTRLFPRGDDGSNNARPGRGDNDNGSSSKVRNKDKSDNNDLLDHKKGVVVVGAIVAGAVIANNLDESKQDREKDNSYIDTLLNETDGTAFVANTTSASTELTEEGEPGSMAGADQEEIPVEEEARGSIGSFCLFDRRCEGDMICVERTCVVTTLNGTDDTASVANTTSASTELIEEVDATASPTVTPTGPTAGSDHEEIPVDEEARRSIASSCLFDRGCEGDMICVERTCVVTRMVGGAGQGEQNVTASISQGEVEESAEGANTVAPEPTVTNESNR